MDGYDSAVTVVVVQTRPFVHAGTGSESSSAVHHFIFHPLPSSIRRTGSGNLGPFSDSQIATLYTVGRKINKRWGTGRCVGKTLASIVVTVTLRSSQKLPKPWRWL